MIDLKELESILTTTPFSLLEELIKHAKDEFPAECAGMVVRNKTGWLEVRKGVNSVKPEGDETIDASHISTNNFVLDAKQVMDVMKEGKEIVAIYHSHPFTPPTPSEADRYACRKSALPWIIINPNTGEFTITNPKDTLPEAPVLGREFVWGIFDCLALVRDVYKAELSIDILDYDRGPFGAWDVDPSWDKFNEYFSEAGFVSLPFSHSKDPHDVTFNKYDVILFNIANDLSMKPNHCGVVMNPDKKIFYHHLYQRESEASVWGSYYRYTTTNVLRHHLLLTGSKA
jgi:proteasome lid subunit RPN8/RPN11